MYNKVHIFLAKVSARKGNDSGYPEGERHSILVFSCQEQGTDHAWEKAEKIANESSWGEVEFIKAGTLAYENVKEKDQVFIECYEEAQSNGSAILVYSKVEQ